MTFTTHKVVYEALGENATTERDPMFTLEGFDGDLTAKVNVCMAFDNDMLITIDRYKVVDVALPSWLPVKEWLSDTISWGYSWFYGMDPTWSESWQRRLLNMSAAKQLACIKLLKTKTFRSDFRRKLCEQLVAWLNGESDYSTPFSPRQWECLVTRYVANEARQLSETAYRRKVSCYGVQGVNDAAA